MNSLPVACGRPPTRPSLSPDGRLADDLAEILKDRLAVYLSLGPDGAVMSVKSHGTYAFGKAFDARWERMTPRERAEVVLAWIRAAARYGRRPRIRYADPKCGRPDRFASSM